MGQPNQVVLPERIAVALLSRAGLSWNGDLRSFGRAAIAVVPSLRMIAELERIEIRIPQNDAHADGTLG